MKIIVRQEQLEDQKIVFELVQKAFYAAPFSDQKEHYLVDRLRNSEAFIPKLSLVAEMGDKIVGHILLTRLKIKNEFNEFESLVLAPVSVLPEYQRKGIGGRLIERSHKKARELGFTSVIVLGHENYYPKFGYQQADFFGIELPFDVPRENCMAIELVENALENVNGRVEYPKAFNE